MSDTEGTPLVPEMLKLSNYVEIALQRGTMMVYADPDSETDGSLKEVPIPEEWVDSGEIPEEFDVDFSIDPSFTIGQLAKQGFTTVESLKDGWNSVAKLAESHTIVDNLVILPADVVKMVSNSIYLWA
ncbi:hypothetical protein BT69DRAFT_604326 [Atractiella rhizophila]|nr:hypothetical protein BT69DRAFT_604326 [Atractiella rhizophila]